MVAGSLHERGPFRTALALVQLLLLARTPPCACAAVPYEHQKHDAAESAHKEHRCAPVRPFPPIRLRLDVGGLLAQLGLVGNAVELGVQRGNFTRVVLEGWKRCTEYVQVDLWRQQQNYADIANLDDRLHSMLRETARATLQEMVARGYARAGTQCANYTSVCAQRYPESHFQFVYVDARHDRLGVLQDLHQWWPKLQRGGLMCGHDYTEQSEPAGDVELISTRRAGAGAVLTRKNWPLDPQRTRQDWRLNFDGSRDETGRAVKGAVDDFFAGLARGPYGSPHELQRCPRQVVVSYRESGWNTWCVRK